MSESRFLPLGPLDSSPNSRAFLGLERGPQGPLWPVVLVWVPEEVEEDLDRMAQLREDTSRAAQIDHPNVIRVIGCERLDEGFARVVEYGDGESLRGFLAASKAKSKPLPTPFFLRVLSDAAAGVHHVHEMGQAEGNVRSRLHGALRPETLMVGFDGVTKVTGYGALAVAPRDVYGARLSPRLQYLSPEEFEGGPGAADRRSDVYGLGLVLYEAVTGRLPYRIDEPEFELRVLAGVVPPEPLLGAPPMLREVILKALARKPADRFATAALFRQAVESLGPWSAEQVAALCGQLVPEGGPERSGRLQLLREVGFPAGPLPRPPARPTAVRPARPTPPGPVPKVVAPPPVAKAAPPPPPPAPAPTALPPLPPPPARPVGAPWIAVLLGGVVVAFLMLGTLLLARPDIARALIYGTAGLAPQPPPVAPAPVAVAPVKPPVPPPEVPPEPLPLPPPAPAPAILEISSEPTMQVSVDGKLQGPTPVSIEVPAGDHQIRYRDTANGIDVERTVRAKEGGHAKSALRLGRASMDVTAPSGAAVQLDGRPRGVAPLGSPLEFYEGRHTIKVKMGKAIFEKQFKAEAGEALTLEVHPTSTPGGE